MSNDFSRFYILFLTCIVKPMYYQIIFITRIKQFKMSLYSFFVLNRFSGLVSWPSGR